MRAIAGRGRSEDLREAEAIVRRFSSLGIVFVLTIMGSGLVNSAILGGITALPTSTDQCGHESHELRTGSAVHAVVLSVDDRMIRHPFRAAARSRQVIEYKSFYDMFMLSINLGAMICIILGM